MRVPDRVRAAVFEGKRPIVFVRCRSPRRVLKDLAADVARGGAFLCHEYRWVSSLLVELRDEKCLERLASLPDVASIELDERGHGTLDRSAAFLGVPEVHDLGVRGEGTVVAVLDTGVDATHPTFDGAIRHEYHFLNQLRDVGVGARDGHGHGTNVAGVIASRGLDAPLGIAPAGQLVVVKVLDDSNLGWISDWTAGIEHVLDLHTAPDGIRIDAINMSLGSDSLHEGLCDGRYRAFFEACRRAEELGIVVVAASGNQGRVGVLTAPACYSSVVSVGSVSDDGSDRVSSFTNRSELLDFLAPGERITSAGLRGRTSVFSGTSQASPHVAALFCLLRGVEPGLAPAAAVGVLDATARRITDEESGLELAIVDGARAVRSLLVPAVSGLECTLVGGTLEVSWEREPAADSFAVHVERDGVELLDELLDGDAVGFRYTSSREGVFEVGVRVVDSRGSTGDEDTCIVDGRPTETPFIRGECDGSGALGLSDSVFLLNYLFLAGRAPPCLEACNANGDGGLDVADASYALNFLFLGGEPPPAPYPVCGTSELARAASCTAAACP